MKVTQKIISKILENKPSSRSEDSWAKALSGSHLTIFLTSSHAFEAAFAGKGPKVFLSCIASLCPTLSTFLKMSNRKAAPHLTVSEDSSLPTVESHN